MSCQETGRKEGMGSTHYRTVLYGTYLVTCKVVASGARDFVPSIAYYTSTPVFGSRRLYSWPCHQAAARSKVPHVPHHLPVWWLHVSCQPARPFMHTPQTVILYCGVYSIQYCKIALEAATRCGPGWLVRPGRARDTEPGKKRTGPHPSSLCSIYYCISSACYITSRMSLQYLPTIL